MTDPRYCVWCSAYIGEPGKSGKHVYETVTERAVSLDLSAPRGQHYVDEGYSENRMYGFWCSRRCARESGGVSSPYCYDVTDYFSGTQSRGGGSCFITTAVCESKGLPDDCHELQVLRRFRDSWMTATPERRALVEEYYRIAPQIVAWLNEQPQRENDYDQLRKQYILPAVAAAEAGDVLCAERLYSEMVIDLKRRSAVRPR